MNIKNRATAEFILGIFLLAAGLFMLLKSMYVSSFGFWTIGRISTGGILLVLLILAVIALVVKPNTLTRWSVVAIVALLIISVLLGTHISFRYMSVADIILIIVPLAIGAGLILRTVFRKDDGE